MSIHLTAPPNPPPSPLSSRIFDFDVSTVKPSTDINEVLETTTSSGKSPLSSRSFRTSQVFSSSIGGNGRAATFSQCGDQTELEKIVSTVSYALTVEQVSKDHCRSVRFEPKGCQWTAILVEGALEEIHCNEEDAANSGNYWIQAVCSEQKHGEKKEVAFREDTGRYQVDMFLRPPSGGGQSEKEAKDMEKHFEAISFMVKKAVARCDFPQFPEGSSGKTFREVYQLNSEIKAGAFAKVMQGTHRASGRKVAAKCVFREKLSPQDDAAIFDEVSIMASLDHPHIVSLYDFFEEPEWYIIVMEFMTGGDLFDRVGRRNHYSEEDARDLCRMMLDAVAYFHDKSVAHCDLKPKNLVLRSENDDSYIKVTDFGFAARVNAPNSLTRQCGTPLFVAPEVLLKRPYDQAADMWSVGVIMYLLLGGTLPFVASNLRSLFKKIVVGKFEFDEKHWFNVSGDAKDLIRSLLIVDPSQRMTARQAMRMTWILQEGHVLRRNDLGASAKELKTFNAKLKLRAAIMAVDWMAKSNAWRNARGDDGIKESDEEDDSS